MITKKILEETAKFYEKLYMEDPNVSSDFSDYLFNSINTPRLSNEDKTQLNKRFTEGELYETLKQMKNNKTPGSDGLTKEFYFHFWSEIKNILLSSYEHSFSIGYLSVEQKRGIIRLIPKKSKDLMQLEKLEAYQS